MEKLLLIALSAVAVFGFVPKSSGGGTYEESIPDPNKPNEKILRITGFAMFSSTDHLLYSLVWVNPQGVLQRIDIELPSSGELKEVKTNGNNNELVITQSGTVSPFKYKDLHLSLRDSGELNPTSREMMFKIVRASQNQFR